MRIELVSPSRFLFEEQIYDIATSIWRRIGQPSQLDAIKISVSGCIRGRVLTDKQKEASTNIYGDPPIGCIEIPFAYLLRESYRRNFNTDIPRSAFDNHQASLEIGKMLMQLRDMMEWGIPEKEDMTSDFLFLWVLYIHARLAAHDLPHHRKAILRDCFARNLTGGEWKPRTALHFNSVWERPDLTLRDLMLIANGIRRAAK